MNIDMNFNYSTKINELTELAQLLIVNLLINLPSFAGKKTGRSKEVGGFVSVPEPACHKAGDGGKGLCCHWKKHAEPGQLHHQQGLLPDLHPGLLHQAYTEW